MAEKEEFLKLSREIQYMIISHNELQIKSEDDLFDIISQIIETKKGEETIEDILFLEQIEFCGLSESKFSEFISVFDFNQMSGQLWKNLCKCFFSHQVKNCQRKLKCHQKKSECNLQSIIVAGSNDCNRLGIKSNNYDKSRNPIIHPPLKSPINPSSLLSYSAFNDHSVLITCKGSLKEVGDNFDCQINGTFSENTHKMFHRFFDQR